MEFDDNDSFGMTIFMPYISFQLELDRSSINDMISSVEEDMDQLEVPQANRITEVLTNAVDLSMSYADENIDPEDAISEIAVSFLYVYVTQELDEPIERVRGVVSVVTENNIHFETLLDKKSYSEASAKIMKQVDQIASPKGPTIH